MNRTVTVGVIFLVVIGSLAAAAVLVCEPLFFTLFDVPSEQRDSVELALRLAAINLAILLVLTAFDATLWGLQRFDLLNSVDIPASVLRGVLTFVLIGAGGGIVALACITLAITIASGIAKSILCFRADPQLRLGYRYLSRQSLGELLGFGTWSLILNVASLSRTQLSPLLIGSLLGVASVAAFSVADRLIGTVAMFLLVGTGVLTPFATALHATKQLDRQRRLFVTGGRYSTTIAFFLIAFLVVLGGPLIELWIGRAFDQAWLLLVILAGGELLPATQHLTRNILMASARLRVLAACALLEVAAMIALAVVLIPAFGLIGVGFAIAIPAAFARGLAPLVQGCRLTNEPIGHYLLNVLAPPLLCTLPAAVGIGFAVAFHPPSTWLSFVAYSMAYTALYATAYACLIGRTRTVWVINEGIGLIRGGGRSSKQNQAIGSDGESEQPSASALAQAPSST